MLAPDQSVHHHEFGTVDVILWLEKAAVVRLAGVPEEIERH